MALLYLLLVGNVCCIGHCDALELLRWLFWYGKKWLHDSELVLDYLEAAFTS